MSINDDSFYPQLLRAYLYLLGRPRNVWKDNNVKVNLKYGVRCGLVSTGSGYEHGNKPSGSLKAEMVWIRRESINLSSRNIFHGVSKLVT
jgi:hypothetical protein